MDLVSMSRKHFFTMFATACMAVLILSAANAEAYRQKTKIICAEGWYARTIAWPTKLCSSNGINFNNNDELYVASVLESTISVINPHNGKVVEKLGSGQGVETPDDLTFGPDGTLYWTAFMTGEVCSLSPEGERNTIARLAPGVNAITMSDEGRLFVTRVFLGDQLYEIDPSGVAVPRLIAEGLGGLNAMDFGPDGFLYGPLWFEGEVVKIDVDSGEMTTVLSGLDTPAAVKFDQNGLLHVLDQHTAEIIQYNLLTDEQVVIAVSDIGIDNLAFNSRNQLFITNAHDGSVVRLFPNGSFRKVVWGGMTSPGGIVVEGEFPRQSLYISDTYSLRELNTWFGCTEKIIHSIVGDVSGIGTPLSLSEIGDKLVTTSWFAGVVQLYDHKTDTLVQSWRDFIVPIFATGYQGDLLVSELETHSVIMRPAGTSKRIVLTDQLSVPAGLAVSGKNCFVSDWASGVVWKIIDDGEILVQPSPVTDRLNKPEGIVVKENILYVVETGSEQVTSVDLNTGEKQVIVQKLPIGLSGPAGYPPTWIFNGIAVDGIGQLFIPLDKTGEICILRKKR